MKTFEAELSLALFIIAFIAAITGNFAASMAFGVLCLCVDDKRSE